MIEVLPAQDKKTFKEFLHFPHKLYKGHPYWVPPLLQDIKEQFSSGNPFFKHGEVVPFIARVNGNTVGRIAAIYNRAHIDFYGEKAGFFGFFDCLDEDAVALALIEKVKHWIREKGMTLLRGPMNFSSNEEWGLLTEGFDSPPMVMMPYNYSYYKNLFDNCGLKKAKDLFAYSISVPEKLPEKVFRVAAIAEKRGIKVRPIDMRSFEKELLVFKKIYNSAWEKNWGFVPMTDEEIEYMAKKLKPVMSPELTLIAEHKGDEVGFIMMLPDVNYVLKKLNGRLFPFGLFKALWYSKKIKNLRLLLFGIKEGHRKQGVDSLMFIEVLKAVQSNGYEKVEFSWILEDNYPVQRLIEAFNGQLYKKYRIYESAI